MKTIIPIIIIVVLAIACTSAQNPTPRPTYTPYPTSIPTPTDTPRPTYTPYSKYPPEPTQRIVEIGEKREWLFGQALTAYEEGLKMFNNAEYEAAIASFKEAQRHSSKQSEVLENWIGLSYAAMGKHVIAIQHHSNAINIRDAATNRVNRAISYTSNNQCEPAMDDARKALSMKPASGSGIHTDVEANIVLASCLFDEGNHLLALQHADAAIDIATEHQYPDTEMAAMTEIRDAIQQNLNR